MGVMISSSTLYTSTRFLSLTAVASYVPKIIFLFDGNFFDDDGAHQSSSSRNNDGSSVPHKCLTVVGAPMIVLTMNGCLGRLWERWKYVYRRHRYQYRTHNNQYVILYNKRIECSQDDESQEYCIYMFGNKNV